MAQEEEKGRRFAIEEIDNGWLVKITTSGSDKFVGRFAFHDMQTLFMFLQTSLKEKGSEGGKR